MRRLVGRISRLEVVVAAVAVVVLVVLAVIEPGILEAPFQSDRALLFTLGGTVAAAAALVLLLWLRVPAVVRVVVLGVPFVAVNWWLISPFFIDTVVDDEFEVSISDASPPPPAPDASPPPETGDAAPEAPPSTVAPTEPVLRGSGSFVGLAGHDGSGDAGLFERPDGSLVLRFERFAIDNGPDLRVYLVPGADQTTIAPGSVGLGALRGNIGDQNYDLPEGTDVAPGPWTALVWCEAFTVEFVAATLTVT